MLSFDVFDTALTRVWFRPVDLFVAVGRELERRSLYAGGAESWALAREEVERDLRRPLSRAAPGAGEEISLAAIHHRLATRLGLATDVRDAGLAIELALERSAIRPIARTCAEIAAAGDAKDSVVFLSDTYFDLDFVAELLRGAGITPAPGTLYTSLALGLTKRTGSLFHHVLAERHLAPSALRHLGDNAEHDVTMARKLGVHAELFTVSRPNRYETQLYGAGVAAARLMRSAVAGAARAARLGFNEADPRHQTIAETGADVAGPALTGFVLWCLVEARRQGLRRLYFLARDGQVLQRMAVILNQWLGFGIDCRYLYVSRQALFLPSITEVDATTLDWLMEDAESTSPRAILARLEFDADDLRDILETGGFPPSRWDAPLGAEGKKRLRALLTGPTLNARILAQAALYRDDLLGYLTQNDMLDGDAFGVVDIGWKGRLQLCLSKVLAGAPAAKPSGFYFGLARRPARHQAGPMAAFIEGTPVNAALLEIFTKADHGSVRRFRRADDGTWAAELQCESDREALEWGLYAQQRGILAFLEALVSVLAPDDAEPDALIGYLRRQGEAVLDLFTHTPSAEEAAAYGALRSATDQTHRSARETAPILSTWRLLALLLRDKPAVGRETYWFEGSAARSLAEVRWQRRGLLGLSFLRRKTSAILHWWRR